MKKLFATIALLLSLNVNANEAIAQYNYATADGSPMSYSQFTMNETKIFDNGLLVVKTTKRIINENGESVVNKSIKKIKIAQQMFSFLKSKIDYLSKTEILTTKKELLCMLMPTPVQANQNLSVVRDGVMTLVDGPRGCWVNEETHPRTEEAQYNAEVVKDIVKSLTK